MANFTYATLKTAVQDWMEDSGSDFTADFDTMLGLAEDRLLKDLDLTIFDVESAITLNAATVTKVPANKVIATRELYIPSVNAFLYPRTIGYIRMRHGTNTGQPIDYADVDAATYLLGPAPDQSYNGKVLVTTRPNSLVVDTTGTFFSTRAADTLFKAVLFESAIYQEKEDLSAFEGPYEQALTSARFELRGLRRRDYSPLAPQPTAVGKGER